MFDMNGWILILKIYKIIIELNVTRILQTKDIFESINGKTDNRGLKSCDVGLFFCFLKFGWEYVYMWHDDFSCV